MEKWDEILKEIDKMFLMAVAIPREQDAEPVLSELVEYIEKMKVSEPRKSLILYQRFKRSAGKNPMLQKMLYGQYIQSLLEAKKRVIDLIKGLQALEILTNQEREKNNGEQEFGAEY